MGRKENDEIRKMFDEVYEMINLKYPHEKPKLKIYRSKSGCGGFCFSKSKEIKINNFHYPKGTVRKTIIHEFCHLINDLFFYRGKLKAGHNTQFWRLAKEFGLGEKDYFMKTVAMKQVFVGV